MICRICCQAFWRGLQRRFDDGHGPVNIQAHDRIKLKLAKNRLAGAATAQRNAIDHAICNGDSRLTKDNLRAPVISAQALPTTNRDRGAPLARNPDDSLAIRLNPPNAPQFMQVARAIDNQIARHKRGDWLPTHQCANAC